MTKRSELGTTVEGREWCLKALHPSDAETTVSGIPDESCVPSFLLNYQTTATIGAQAGATGTWSGSTNFIAHPSLFGAHKIVDSIGSTFSATLNSQLPGTAQQAGSSLQQQQAITWLGMASKWRIAYAGLTITQDGPALSDQGSIAVCQSDLPHKTFNYACGTPPLAGFMTGHIYQFNSALSSPNFNTVENMPGAYVGPSKEGAYIPLKLTKTSQQWHGWEEVGYLAPADVSPTNQYVAADVPNTFATTTSVTEFPFYGLNSFAVNTGSNNPLGDRCILPSNETVANICYQNVSVNTRFLLYFRIGYEIQVLPGTLYTPEQRISPQYDPAAISAYFEVSRALKDAYPASYNSKGKLWSVISELLSGASPFLKQIPGYGMPIGMGVDAVNSLGNMISKAIDNRSMRNQKKVVAPKNNHQAPQQAKSGKSTFARPQRK